MKNRVASSGTTRQYGHTRKGCGSSPSHRQRCKDAFRTTFLNKIRRLRRQVSKHPSDLQAKADLSRIEKLVASAK